MTLPARIRAGAAAALLAGMTAALASLPEHVLTARVVAVGVRDVGGVRQVGAFHAGGPMASNPQFMLQTRPGRVLDPNRLLVASGFNFGAPAANPRQAPGSILSIDPSAAQPVVVAPAFARDGVAARNDAALQLFSAQSPVYLNRVHNPGARTAAEPAVANPRYISINNAFGRPWFASSPYGPGGPGTSSVLDPDGRPLANAPSDHAGGVFSDAHSNRQRVAVAPPWSRPPGLLDHWLRYRASTQLTPGSLTRGAVGTAFLGASPDTTGFAVFAVVQSDGSVVQVHVQDGVDGLAPPGTVAPVDDRVALAGVAFNWVPDRALFIADRAHNRIAVLELGDDGRHFTLKQVRHLSAPQLSAPVDLAAAVPEVANPRFASHTTLAAGADLYVANRGDGSLLRLTPDGRVLARSRVRIEGLGLLGGERLRGIAVSADAQRLWLTVEGELPQHPGHEGVVIEVPAFDAAGPYRTPPRVASTEPGAEDAAAGARWFAHEFSAAEGLGPRFNQRSCAACHHDPDAGGFSTAPESFVRRVARGIGAGAGGRTEAVEGGPVAHRFTTAPARSGSAPGHAVAPLGVPREANVVSLRMSPALYGLGRVDAIPDAAILAHAVAKGDGIHGRPNRVRDARGELRVGRYGWKADIAQLDEMVATALAHEIGITTPLASALDPLRTHEAAEDDGRIVRALVAFIERLRPPPQKTRP